MLLQALRFMPAGVIDEKDSAFARLGRNGLGQLIQKTLEAVGIHRVEDHGEALSGGRGDCADHVGPDVIA